MEEEIKNLKEQVKRLKIENKKLKEDKDMIAERLSVYLDKELRRAKAGRKSKFSFEEEKKIIEKYESGDYTMKQLAEEYNCSASLIHKIINS